MESPRNHNGYVFYLDNPGGQVSWNLNMMEIGDNQCHDYLNRPECLYDFGDCCNGGTQNDVGNTCYACFCYSDSETGTQNTFPLKII